LLKKEPDNIDVRYMYLEVLRWKNMDLKDDQEEPLVNSLCTSIIRGKENHKQIIVANAYCYRGAIKYYAIDRRKDFDKAKEILENMNNKDPEVRFLKKFIGLLYPLHVRQYLHIHTDYRNLYKF
jgi:spore coat polysaccharide biosynthesis protein SpsF (cytidylyltransferase family)